ncbi:MAG: hypothetical protein RLZ10_233 [Bacteroidota bacterium]
MDVIPKKKPLNNSVSYIRNVGFFLLGLFVLFFVIGTYSNPIELEIKKAAIPKVNSVSKKIASQKDQNFGKTIVKKDSAEIKPIKTGGVEKILLVGDSQLEAMRKPFYNYITVNNHELLATVLWYGSSSKQWANTDTLLYYINKFKPTMVVLVLGLNELFVNDFDQRRTNIQKIKAQLVKKGINHYWIGPAAWKKDSGVIKIMEEEWGNRFFSSQKLILGRAKDNRHPSNDAAWIWMNAVSKEATKSGILNLPKPIAKQENPKKSPFVLLKVPK